MPRPKNPFPKEKMQFSLPQELAAKLRIVFASELSYTNGGKSIGRIPGAMSSFVEQAIVEKFEREAAGLQKNELQT